MSTTKAAAVNPAPPFAAWENVGSQDPRTNVKSQTAKKANATSNATWATPASGCESLLNGQLPNVKPVKMNARMVQKSREPTAACEAPTGLQSGSASSHHESSDTIQLPAVITAAVAAPNRGTASATSTVPTSASKCTPSPV